MPRVPIFLIIALLLVMAFTLAQWLSVPPTASPEIPEEVPSHLVKSIDIDLDQCKQMETWTLAIIAGLTAMVLSNDVRVRITTKGQLAAYLLAGLACFASIVAAIYYQSPRGRESLTTLLPARDDDADFASTGTVLRLHARHHRLHDATAHDRSCRWT